MENVKGLRNKHIFKPDVEKTNLKTNYVLLWMFNDTLNIKYSGPLYMNANYSKKDLVF